ncbi:MAG: hypothetical protein GX621_11760 [Pirellulaceae bacterium]|nr:hypothetical protein [Pirellulaceae bacterium]
MNDRTPRLVWPFLLTLAVLLTVAATTPRAWQEVARKATLDESLAQAEANSLPLPSADPRPTVTVVDTAPAAPMRRMRVVPASVSSPGAESDPIDDGWMPAEALPKRTMEPLAEKQSEIALPRLSMDSNARAGEGPSFGLIASSLAGPSLVNIARDVAPKLVVRLPAPTQRAVAMSDSGRTRPDEPVAEPSASIAEGALDEESEEAPGDEDDVVASTEIDQTPEEVRSIWCRPLSLHAQLNELASSKETARWAEQTEKELDRLGAIVDEHPDWVSTTLARLRELVVQADRLADHLKEPELAMRLRRASYSLQRRLDTWECVLARTDWDSPLPERDAERLRSVLAEVDAITRASEPGLAWRDFLSVEALQEASRDESPSGAARLKNLARGVLGRVAATPLTDAQRAFLEIEPLSRLAGQLRRVASGPPSRAYLLAVIERYELNGRASDGRRLADECLWLSYWPEGPFGDLQHRIATHYRNANVRVVLSENLLNQLMPEQLPEYERVRDTILGNPVRGERLSATEVAIRLIPDERRLRLALEVTGEVAALTSSNSGPARFQNTSESHYVARKPMELTVDGLKVWPAEVDDVSNVTRLRRVQTTLDGIPVLGSLMKNVAKNQHDMKRSEVRREVERKISTQARQRIDEETDARLTEFSDRFSARVLEPMKGMLLGPDVIQAVTTEDRLTMRLRVASRQQLGASTPRPMAPGNSQASFQIHQTALNNMVEQLELNGETMKLPELRARLAERLRWPEIAQRTTENDDVTITFAGDDAVLVTCDDGLVTIDLSIACLRKARRAWRNFQVRVSYRPVVDGLSAELVREGVVKLPGPRLSTNSQVALRAIFCKIFSQHATREIVPERIRNHPKLSELAVTQMVMEDGWIAFALGPKERIARAGSEQRAK